MDIVDKKIEDLIPYENNPRINDNAVDYVAKSIQDFGFKVPLVIDTNNVIVAGHTRYLASKKLGLDKIPCLVANDLNMEQIKAFRLVDNKVAEYSEWDMDKLQEELKEFENFDFTKYEFEFKNNTEEELEKLKEIELKDNIYELIIKCDNEKDMEEKFNIIKGVGLDCRISTL